MMKIKSVWLRFIIVFFIPFFSAQATTQSQQKDTVTAGWLEYVVLEPWQMKLRAKLDTGAKTSSLHAVNIERFKRDGQPWVRFSTEDKKNGTVTKTIELAITREVKIKSHHRDAASRPVVTLSFCLNSHLYHGEFSLVDRTRFNYPVLLGRRILQHGILVDASTTFTLPINAQHCEQLFNEAQSEKEAIN
jgi:hypothetical protein